MEKLDRNPASDAMMLLIGLWAHKDLLAHAVEKCSDLQLFDPLAESGLHLIWECLVASHKTYNKCPTEFMLNGDVARAFAAVATSPNPPKLEQIDKVLPMMSDKQPVESRERVQERLIIRLQVAVHIGLREDSKKFMTPGEQARRMSEMSDLLNNAVPESSVRKRPLDPALRKQLLRVTPRYSWGLPYWDCSGSTWYKKEIHGLLGPSGGGKTVNACTIAESTLRAGMNVALVLYEQALEEDVTQRLYANLCSISMDKLRGKNYEELDPEVQDKMDRVSAKYIDHLMVLDMVGENAGNGGPQEMFQHLREERESSGFWPDLIIVDWLGEMALRYSKQASEQDGGIRRTMEHFMSEFNQFKETPGNETTFLVLHQTSTNAQGAGPGYRPKRTDAHEFRSFANKCDSCCQIGTMDNDNICWFIPGKVRRGQRTERIIKLNGEYMRFEDVSNQYQEHPTGGSFITRDAAGEMAARNEVEEEDFSSVVQ
jgi:hypothetical protein